MKKINTLCYIIGAICFIIAGYIIYDKFTTKDDIDINFNEDEEIEVLNDKLSEIGSPLGWTVIVDGINNQDDNCNYVITFNEDLLDNYEYRQLFVMEYILSNTNNYDLFTVFDMDGKKIEDSPTGEFTFSYIDYTDFNDYYLSIFGENFDMNRANKGDLLLSYSDNYVYYDNRRAGSNGVYVSMIQADGVEYEDGVYRSTVTVTYSTRASELIGEEESTAIIEYTKDINNNIILESFTLKDR